jgi:N-acyl homoserine lactone hydrolase
MKESRMKTWKIAPLLLGTGPRFKCFITYLKNPEARVEIAMIAWLVFNHDERIIIDTGPSPSTNTAKFHKPVMQTPEQNLEMQLKRFDTRLEDVRMVINTHLHWDHCYGNSLFKNARFFVQKIEMEYARNPLPCQLEMYEVKQEEVVPPFEGIDFELIDGDAELAPGIKVMLMPGHTPGSQAVSVQTSEEVYLIAGDNIPLYDNLSVPEGTPFIPNGIFTDLEKYYESLDRMQRFGFKILPGHDVRIFEKAVYPS